MRHEAALRSSKIGRLPGSSPDFSGTWRNELGSSMELSIDGDRVRGTYHSAVSGEDKAVTGELIGFVVGDQITFSVNWSPLLSLTSWVGQLKEENGQSQLHTLWLLTQEVPDEDEGMELWQSTLIGSDTFARIIP